MAKIGLVTVLFKSESVLPGFFRSLALQDFLDFHLYLIDNSPNKATDDLINELLKEYPLDRYTHIKNTDNVGVAAGNNQGIRSAVNAGCTHIILLNNDVEFTQPYLLRRMYESSIRDHHKIIIPKIRYFDTGLIWMAGGEFNRNRGIVQHVGEGMNDGPQFGEEKDFEYAPTCFMLIDKEVFDKIGIMDEKYFVYYDDTDFIFRANRYGYLVHYLPQLDVLHKVSTSTGGGETQFTLYYNTRNRVYFIIKNFKGLQRIIALIFTLATRLLKWVIYPVQKRKIIYGAILDGFKM